MLELGLDFYLSRKKKNAKNCDENESGDKKNIFKLPPISISVLTYRLSSFLCAIRLERLIRTCRIYGRLCFFSFHWTHAVASSFRMGIVF